MAERCQIEHQNIAFFIAGSLAERLIAMSGPFIDFFTFAAGSSQTGGLDWRTGDSNGFVSGVGAPAYLSVTGYELCLEYHQLWADNWDA